MFISVFYSCSHFHFLLLQHTFSSKPLTVIASFTSALQLLVGIPLFVLSTGIDSIIAFGNFMLFVLLICLSRVSCFLSVSPIKFVVILISLLIFANLYVLQLCLKKLKNPRQLP